MRGEVTVDRWAVKGRGALPFSACLSVCLSVRPPSASLTRQGARVLVCFLVSLLSWGAVSYIIRGKKTKKTS